MRTLRSTFVFYRSILSRIGPSTYATKKPPLQITAEHHKITWLTRLTSPHVVGSSASHASPARSRGAITYVITKLQAISVPAMLNVHTLCRDRFTSQGAVDRIDATAVPIPSSTSTDGSAQQISVLNEPNNEK